MRGIFVSEENAVESKITAGTVRAQPQRLGPTRGAQAREPFPDQPTRLRAETLAEGSPREALRVIPQQTPRRRIGFDDFLSARIDREHCVADRLQQQSITRLGEPQFRVIALQRLLGLDQSLLQRRHGAQIATLGEASTIVVEG